VAVLTQPPHVVGAAHVHPALVLTCVPRQEPSFPQAAAPPPKGVHHEHPLLPVAQEAQSPRVEQLTVGHWPGGMMVPPPPAPQLVVLVWQKEATPLNEQYRQFAAAA